MRVPVEGKKKKSPLVKILGGGCILIVLFIIVIAGCSAIFMSGGGDESPATSGAPVSEAEEEAPAEVEAEPVDELPAAEDAEVSIVADSVERTKTLGSDGFEQDAQGEYVMVFVTVTNNSGEEATISGDDFTLIGVDGTEYGTSTDLPITLDAEPLIFDAINPGNSVSGYILFDVPEGTDLDYMQFEALFSFDGPSKVTLP